jgi:hypothetical protein
MGFLLKGSLLYLLLAVALAFGAPGTVFNGTNPTDATFLSWFNIRLDPATNVISYDTSTYDPTGAASSSFGNLTAQWQAPTNQGTFFSGLDPLFQVFSWIGTFGKMLFSPIIMLTKPEMTGAPIAILFIIAIPIVLLFLIGIIGWIRSGEL